MAEGEVEIVGQVNIVEHGRMVVDNHGANVSAIQIYVRRGDVFCMCQHLPNTEFKKREWISDDKYFVETKACEKAREKLDRHYYVTIAGFTGDGKTATAQHLLLEKANEGYELKILRNINQLEMAINPDEKQVVFIDNIVKCSFDKKKVKEFKDCIYAIEKHCETAEGNTLVVMTACTTLLQEAKEIMTKEIERFFEKSIVDFTKQGNGENVSLSEKEKKSIVLKCMEKYNLDTKTHFVDIDNIVKTPCPYAFPLCANMWAKSQRDSENKGLDYFRSPRDVIDKDLCLMKENDHHTYNFLTLLLFKKQMKISEISNEARCIVDDPTLPELLKQDFHKSHLTEKEWKICVDKSIGIYVKKDEDDMITFYHDIISEQMYISFSQHYPQFSIRMFPFDFISTVIRTKIHETLDHEKVVKIEIRDYGDLASRFITEIRLGNVSAVAKHPACRDVEFVNTFIDNLFKEKDAKFLLEVREEKENTKFYASLLFWAAKFNDIQLCKLLIPPYEKSLNENKFFLKLQSSAALMHLIRNNCFHEDLIKSLLSLGADTCCSLNTSENRDVYMYNCNHCSLVDKEGENILQIAMEVDEQEEHLVQRLIDVLDIDLRNYDGWSNILSICVRKGWNNLAKRVFESNSNPDREGKHELPIWDAVRMNNCVLAGMLLDKCKNINDVKNSQDIPLLMVCVSLEMLKLLYQHGVDLSTTDDKDRHLLFYVQCHEMAKFLLQKKLDVNKRDCDSSTPLHHVRNVNVLNIMLEENGDILALDKDNNTPLHVANNGACFELMMKHLKHHGICYKKLPIFKEKTPLFTCTDEDTLREMIKYFNVNSSITQIQDFEGGCQQVSFTPENITVDNTVGNKDELTEQDLKYLSELYNIEYTPTDCSSRDILQLYEDRLGIGSDEEKLDKRNGLLLKACNCQCLVRSGTYCSKNVICILLLNDANPTISTEEKDNAIKALCKSNCRHKGIVLEKMLQVVVKIYNQCGPIEPQLRHPFEKVLKEKSQHSKTQNMSLEKYSVETGSGSSYVRHWQETEDNEEQEGFLTKGMTPLMYHAKEATLTVQMLQMFLSDPLDVKKFDVNEKTMLHHLFSPQRENSNTKCIIEFLVSNLPSEVLKEFLNMTDNKGNTALHYASSCKMVSKLNNKNEVLDLLVSYGADPSRKNNKNEHVLHILYKCHCRNKCAITRTFLQSDSVDLNSKSEDNETCLQKLCRLKVNSRIIQHDVDCTVELLLNKVGKINDNDISPIQSTMSIETLLFILEKRRICTEQELCTIYKMLLEQYEKQQTLNSWAILCQMWKNQNTLDNLGENADYLRSSLEQVATKEIIELLVGNGRIGMEMKELFNRYRHVCSQSLVGMKFLLRGIESYSDFVANELWIHKILKENITKSTSKVIELLIQKGWKINKKSNGGKTPLSILLESNGDDENVAKCLQLMIKYKVDLLEGLPLISAAKSKRQRTKCIEILLQNGVEVNQCDSEGKNALHYLISSFSCHHQTKGSILQAFFLFCRFKIDLFHTTYKGQSVLDLTIENFESELSACALFDTYFVQCLVEKMFQRAKENEVQRCKVNTAMHRFVEKGKFRINELLKKLLDIGLDPGIKDASGRNALHCSAKQMNTSSFKTVLLLLHSGKIDVNAVDNDGKSALHLFSQCSKDDSLYCMQARVHIMKCLIICDADPNLKDNEQNTVLHDVMYQFNRYLGHTEDSHLRYLHVLAMMVSLLVSHSANTATKNKDKLSVVDLGEQSSEKMDLFIRKKGVTMDLVLEHLTNEWRKARRK